jgi:hypothetical protein
MQDRNHFANIFINCLIVVQKYGIDHSKAFSLDNVQLWNVYQVFRKPDI